MEKIRVVIADDVEVITQSLKGFLEKDERIEVIGIANDGEEEWNKILELKPDLVFTDNQMPKMNGIQVIEKMYNLDIVNKPKFVLVTADRDMELYNRAYKNGTILIINKPVDERRIKDAVDEYVAVMDDEMEEKVKEKLREGINHNVEKTKESFLEKIKKIFNK